MANPLQRNEIREFCINGYVYKIELLGGKKGKEIALMLSRIVGPSVEATDKVAKLCELLTDAQFDKLCDTFAAKTAFSPESNPAAEFLLSNEFDRHFAGHYGTMVLWLKACLEANYGAFLHELGVDLGSLKDLLALAMKPETATPTTLPADPMASSGASSLRASGA
jgi:tail assembly chaperone